MKVLTINCGSSSLKFEIIEIDKGTSPDLERQLAKGKIENIGDRASLNFSFQEERNRQENISVANHAKAIDLILDWLNKTNFLNDDGIEAVGHRVVHGGNHFLKPTKIDRAVIDELETLKDLAPLHNASSLDAIRATDSSLGSTVPMVVTFDTTFHINLPDRASQYAIGKELAAKYQIRRYGFHGLAHRYMLETYAATTNIAIEGAKLITLQLGGGCSATAIAGGKSVDTSMGFTPLEGLMMGTRCGDIDPSLIAFLAQKEKVSIETIEDWLNKKSGLLGVWGQSSDMREIIAAESQGDSSAAKAIAMFCYRVRKYIGAYLMALEGADAIVFGGGIGENHPVIRDRICEGMEWCGLTLDRDLNNRAVGNLMKISKDNSTIHAYVVPVNEAVAIARDTFNCLNCDRDSQVSF
jgi:acetate kinase